MSKRNLASCTLFLAVCLICFVLLPMNLASAKDKNKTILFIPQDNRPISFEQTADNIKDLGYEVLSPPEKLLGNRENPEGSPEKLSQWAKENAPKANAAVIASDAIVYGSLVASRKHELTDKTAIARVDNIAKIHQANPKMKLYVFGSIMRTPHTAIDSGGQDDEEFIKYVKDIAKYTALKDKQEQNVLNSLDKVQLTAYEEVIPQKVINKWLARRSANFAASRELIALAADGQIDYLVLGCDDNAKYSQTNRDKRQLDKYAQILALTNERYESVAGIDELAYILLTRAVNNLEHKAPTVSVHYAEGVGKYTIPAASNETIGQTIAKQITMAGGKQVNNDNADLIFMVNTSNDGSTGAANDKNNTYIINKNVQNFVASVDKLIKANKNVAIGDITFGNGSDNSLMQSLYKHKILGKITGYSGWNTPTNSTGYAIAMGMSALYTDRMQINKMLAVRYIDDWLYQANARQSVANKLSNIQGIGNYNQLDAKKTKAEELATEEIQKLIVNYQIDKLAKQFKHVKFEFPWNRMYEAKIIF